MKNLSKLFLFVLIAITSFYSYTHDLDHAIKSEDRTDAYKARDIYRHPYETINFFQIKPNMTVVELSPGSGWYTEIFANYLHEPGNLIAAHFDADSTRAYFKNSRIKFEQKISSSPMYKNVSIVNLSSDLAPEESVDAVVTFRNLHNWLGQQMDDIFSASFKSLKPGGIFGVVEHRAKPGSSLEIMKKTGYVTEEYAIAMANKHGFALIASSEINANPKDTKDHPKGVWTLPPTLRLKDTDMEKYISIGESDRMTLLFRKPNNS